MTQKTPAQIKGERTMHVAKALAKMHHANPSVPATKAAPLYVAGNIRVMDGEPSLSPLWTFFFQAAQVAIEAAREFDEKELGFK